jgi:hypothetical protein
MGGKTRNDKIETKEETIMATHSLEEMREKARSVHEKGTKATFAKKRKEGYNYWCHALGIYTHHRVYFKTIKSAEAWLKRHKSTSGIYPL